MLYGSKFHNTYITNGCYIKIRCLDQWLKHRTFEDKKAHFDSINRNPQSIFRFQDIFDLPTREMILTKRKKLSRIKIFTSKKIEIFTFSMSKDKR